MRQRANCTPWPRRGEDRRGTFAEGDGEGAREAIVGPAAHPAASSPPRPTPQPQEASAWKAVLFVFGSVLRARLTAVREQFSREGGLEHGTGRPPVCGVERVWKRQV